MNGTNYYQCFARPASAGRCVGRRKRYWGRKERVRKGGKEEEVKGVKKGKRKKKGIREKKLAGGKLREGGSKEEEGKRREGKRGEGVVGNGE